MPIRHCIVHLIEKKPDGTPAVLHARDSELGESQAMENLLADLNESYNAKQGKAWGFFHGESGAYPFSGWLAQYMEGSQDFTAFSRQAVEHLQKLMEESNLSTGGHVLFAHYQQGMTDYLAIALLHHSEGVTVTESLDVAPAKHLDLGQLHLAARINISEWQNNKQSKQYISFIKGKNGKKVSDYFRDFIGCQEGVDGPGETRTLLKAFSDFVESEDLPEEQAREKTKTLVGYATSQSLRDTYQIVTGASLIWSPVKDLDIGVEGQYIKTGVKNGRVFDQNRGGSPFTVSSEDVYQARFRVQRDF